MKQAELLEQLTGVKNENTPTELIKHNPIENTPFSTVGNDEQGYFVRFANYRITETFKSEAEAIDYLWDYYNQWTIITNLIITVIDLDKKIPVKL